MGDESKPVVMKEEDKENIKLEDAANAESNEEKMEIDTNLPKTENGIKDEDEPLVLKIEPNSKGVATLVIDGIDSEDDDEDEEFVIMSPEEIRQFLDQEISELVNDHKRNPLLALQDRSQNLLDEIKEKHDDLNKFGKGLDIMYRNQEKFLRHMGVFPKVPTHSVSVSVDLPLLKDSVPLMSPSKLQDEDAVIKKDLPEGKVLHPSYSRMKPSTSTAVPNISPMPNLPSGLTITPAVPSAKPISIPAVPSTSSTTPAVAKANAPAPVPNPATAVKKLAPKPAGDIECIDLTDDTPVPPIQRPVASVPTTSSMQLVKHPAPLPPKPFSVPNKNLPNIAPKPRLKISSEERGIVLQWDMPPCYSTATAYAKLKSFDIFGYQEQTSIPINTLLWKKIGAVKAMTLPMACTLTQFVEGQRYHFSIRAVDVYDRCGAYSDPISVTYKPTKK